MPIDYAIDAESSVLVVKGWGTVSVLERTEVVRTLVRDQSLPHLIPVLIDASQITNIPEPDDIPKIAFLAEQLGKRFKTKVAYYVVKPGMVTPYHLVALSIFQGRTEVSTFCNKLEAYRWLKSTRD